MNEVQYERSQELAAMGQAIQANLEAILSDNGSDMNVAALYRSIYKYTACGPWLSVRLHDGTVVHCQDLHKVSNGDVAALRVGSIVEGSDAEVAADWIELGHPDYMDEDGPMKVVEVFNRTLDWVNEEACALWHLANDDDDVDDDDDDSDE